MSSITIRKLDPAVKERLRVRAAEHGHSMEAEAREIIQSAIGSASADLLPKRTGADLVARIRARFEPLGGVELELPTRDKTREPPRFD
jgi:plasmid stability protein